jgi:hypothetical protein
LALDVFVEASRLVRDYRLYEAVGPAEAIDLFHIRDRARERARLAGKPLGAMQEAGLLAMAEALASILAERQAEQEDGASDPQTWGPEWDADRWELGPDPDDERSDHTAEDEAWWAEHTRQAEDTAPVSSKPSTGPTAADWADYAAWSARSERSDFERWLDAQDSPDASGAFQGHDA